MKENNVRIPTRTKAILCILCAGLGFAFMNLFVSLSGDVPTVQKTFFRNFFAMIIASVAMVKNKCSIIPPKGARFDLVMRSTIGYLGVVFNFYAISRLNISDASVLNKMSPFFAVVFSIFLLNEKADKVQWALISTAFAGALFVIKPSFHNAELTASLLGFISGICAGCAYTFVRRATKKGVKGYYIVFFFSTFSTLAALPLTLLNFKPMTTGQFFALVGAGVSAAAAQFAITAAYSFAPAKEVSVYDYVQILFAAILGFIFMHQIPDGWSFLGYAIIIGAAYAMFRYNNRAAKRPPSDNQQPQ